MKYPKLFERGKIGKLELKNRIVMPAMGTGFASFTGEATDEIIGYYEERAKAGCGLIITEITRIDDETGIGMPGQLSVTSGKYVRKLIQLIDAVHKYDCKIFVQLHHPGREISSYMLNGKQPVAPSPIACQVIGETPHELTTEECEELIKKFISGANIARLAGFDGVELHAAHGYLINQFLSPYSNKRTDKFGGDFEGRLNFIASVIMGIKSTCGSDFPISVRLSADEYLGGGLTLDDSIKIAQALEKLGVHAINVSAGTYESGYSVIEPQGLPEGWKKHLATGIKQNISIPVIAVNNIKYPATAEQFLNDEVCDFVAIGRGQLADGKWAEKAMAGEDGKIRKCLGCMNCFYSTGLMHPAECTVNPRAGREIFYNDDTLKRNGDGKTVAVIGGGPAGMNAAAILGKRGYNTILFERKDALGGTMLLAKKPPHKEMIADLIKTQEQELIEAGVDVRLNTEATPDIIKSLNPHGIMIATGGVPIIPNLPGIDKFRVSTAEDVLEGDFIISGKNVVIVGGGVTGLETAEILSKEHTVTVVEMMDQVGVTLYASVRGMLLKRLADAGVTILTGKRMEKVTNTVVTLKDVATGEMSELDADAVILALGVKSNRDLATQLQGESYKVTCLGDADKPGQIANAMRVSNDKAYIF